MSLQARMEELSKRVMSGQLTKQDVSELWDFLPRLLQEELAEILGITLPWMALDGPQTLALASPADELFYGGAAGGGKTDLLLGAAHTQHQRSVIFRREYAQLKSIMDRAAEIFKDLATRSGRVWNFNDGRMVEFGAMQHLGDETKWQGRPHDLKAYDEITHFLEIQYRYTSGWNRSRDHNQRCRIIATGNPPSTPEGEWVIQHWGPWLDPKHRNPAAPGVLRWFTNIDGVDTEVENGDQFVYKGRVVTPRSRTFIPAALEDNPYYMASNYGATLQALPEPLRSQLLYGSFEAGRDDHEMQIIPTEWVLAAQARWAQRPKPDKPMTAIGVDIARGGKDNTILSPLYGDWMDEQVKYPGTSTPDGPAVAQYVIRAQGTHKPAIRLDVIGVGASVFDFLKAQPLIAGRVFGLNSSSASDQTDKSGQLTFVNLRAEMWWKMRERLDPANGATVCLPPSRSLMIDLTAPRWKLTPSGIQVEKKDEVKKRINRSPDEGDSCIYAFHQTYSAIDAMMDYYKS